MEHEAIWLSGFYKGLYNAVDDPSLDSIVSWSKSNKSFIIWNPKEFERQFLSRPGQICCTNLSRFLTGLDDHGFERVKGSEHLEFGHEEYFVRGQPELLWKMQKWAFLDRHMEVASKLARAKLAREDRAKELANGLHNMRI